MRTGAGLRVIIGLLTVCGATQATLAGGSASLADEIRSVVNSRTPAGMRVGIRVDCLSGPHETLFARNADAPLKPASNQKIITTAAALTVLGKDFKYRTVLAKRGDDLVIVGSGDPTIGDPVIARRAGESITAVFHRWAEAMKQAGITHVRGDLIFDDTLLETEHVHPSWKRMFNLQQWYTAPVGGLNFNDNCVDVVIKPAETMGEPAKVRLVPDTPWAVLRNTATTASKGEPIIGRSGDGPITVSVSGKVSRPNTAENPFSLTVVDPGMFFATTCRTVLAAEGITIDGETRRRRILADDGALPKDLDMITFHETRLGDFLWRLNKSSQNMFAEALFKTLGYHYLATHKDEDTVVVGSNKSGRTAVVSFLEHLHLDVKPEWIDDGSGLSHDNRTTADVMMGVLGYMAEHPDFDVYRESLAEPGEEVGTLRHRMESLAGQVFAKTGTIRGVSCLSGYVAGKDQQMYAFVVICNDTHKAKGGTWAAKRLQEAVCKTLATHEPAPVGTGG